MQQVKNKDSKIEVLLRKELWSRGLRYRKNVNHIYGKPDIVFTYFYKSQQGSQIMFDEPALIKNVTVSELPAEIYIFADPEKPKAILWNTRWAVYQFLITADADEETLIELAESIVMTKDNTHKNPTLPPDAG